ncbi:MAG: hypothetical protein JRN39_00625 [Nitrososphaerota archaeon]|nr:hypothetical protein [Nitrososphaerota archaeon]MDG6938900.1 hypothetical protein [Nitrososphaerota archaeon]
MSVPRSLGISPPAGGDVHEVYLTIELRPSALLRISEVMDSNDVHVVEAHFQTSRDTAVAHAVLYVQLGRIGADALLEALKGLDYVTEARVESRGKIFFEDAMFPLTSEGHHRVFAIGGTAWASLTKSLATKLGSAGGVILQQGGMAVGREEAARIAERLSKKQDKQALLDNLRGMFRASGFGVLDLSETGRGYQVQISDTVSSESDEPSVDHFLVGMVRGALGMIEGHELVVKDPRCVGRAMRFALERAEGGQKGASS